MTNKIILCAAAALLACAPAFAQKGKGKDVKLENRVDSVSYSVGLFNAQSGIKQMLTDRFQLDSTYYSLFLKGFRKGAECDSKKKMAEIVGFYHGLSFDDRMVREGSKTYFPDDSTKVIDKQKLIAAFEKQFMGQPVAISVDSANAYMARLRQEVETKQIELSKIENAAFLNENKTKEGVVTTQSGLQYKILVEGHGAFATENDKVRVNYVGKDIHGNEFDSSYKRNAPAEFTPNQVIKGWKEALTMMPVGSKWEIYIPYTLGYGERGAGPIKPYATLVFEIELLDIVK